MVMTVLFCSVILGVFGIGAWLWHKQQLLLGAEQADLEILRDNLINRPVGSESDPRLNLVNPSGVVRQRVEALLDVRDRSGRLDSEALAHVSEARLTHDNVLIRYIAGSLILMGLFGTLVGLIYAVGGLSQAIAGVKVDVNDLTQLAESFSNIAGEIKGTLAGMQTAFWASLCGVFTTIALSFMLAWLTQAQERFLSELEEIVTRLLAPHYFPQEQSQNLGQFTKAMQETRKLLDLVSEKIKTDASKADDSFNSLKAVVGSFNRFTTTFQDKHGEAQKQLLEQLGRLTNMIKGIESGMKSNVDTVTNMAAISKTSFTEIQKTITDSQENLDKSYKIFQAAMDDIFSRQLIGSFTTSLGNFDKSSAELVLQLGYLKDQQEKATRELQQLGHFFSAEGRFSEVSALLMQSNGNLEKKADDALASDIEQLAIIKELHTTLKEDALNHTELVTLTKQLVDLHKENGKYSSAKLSRQLGEEGKGWKSGQAVDLLQEIALQMRQLNTALAPPSRSLFDRLFGGALRSTKESRSQNAPPLYYDERKEKEEEKA